MTYHKYHEATDTSINRISLDEASEKAYQFAIDSDLIQGNVDYEDEILSTIYIWKYEDAYTTEYYLTQEEAETAYSEAIDYYEAELEVDNDLTNVDEYFVMSKSLWEGDEWSPVYSTNHKEEADEISELLSDDSMSEHGQDLSHVVETLVITKQDLVDKFDYKISDAQETVAMNYHAVEAERYPSQAGAVNVYMPAGYKSKAERLAKFYGYKDNKRNVSISGLIRGLIDQKLNSSLIVDIISNEQSPMRRNHQEDEFETFEEEVDSHPLDETATDDELLGQ